MEVEAENVQVDSIYPSSSSSSGLLTTSRPRCWPSLILGIFVPGASGSPTKSIFHWRWQLFVLTVNTQRARVGSIRLSEEKNTSRRVCPENKNSLKPTDSYFCKVFMYFIVSYWYLIRPLYCNNQSVQITINFLEVEKENVDSCALITLKEIHKLLSDLAKVQTFHQWLKFHARKKIHI